MNRVVDWRSLALLLALFALWALSAFAPGCDGGKPRPSELIPAKPDHGAYARTLAKGRAAEAVKAGRLTLLEAAAAFRDADRDNPDAPPGDLDAYCEQVIAWVRGPGLHIERTPKYALPTPTAYRGTTVAVIDLCLRLRAQQRQRPRVV